MQYRSSVLALLCGAWACSDSTGPEARVPQLGTYSYSVDFFAIGHTWEFNGEYRVTFADADSVKGTWSVPGYLATQPRPIGWNVDAYLVMAQLNGGPLGIVTNRLARTSSGYSCSGRWNSPDGTGPISCSFEYVGP